MTFTVTQEFKDKYDKHGIKTSVFRNPFREMSVGQTVEKSTNSHKRALYFLLVNQVDEYPNELAKIDFENTVIYFGDVETEIIRLTGESGFYVYIENDLPFNLEKSKIAVSVYPDGYPLDGTITPPDNYRKVDALTISRLATANLKLYINGTLAVEGSSYLETSTLKIVANAGYIITAFGFYNEETWDTTDGIISPDGTFATYDYVDADEVDSYISYTTKKGVAGAIGYLITASDMNQFTTNKVTLTVDGEPARVGMDLKLTSTLLFKPVSGYIIVAISIENWTVDPFQQIATVAIDGSYATLDYVDMEKELDFEISTKVKSVIDPDPDPDPVVENYIVTTKFYNDLNSQGVQLLVDGVIANVGYEIVEGATVAFKATLRPFDTIQSFHPLTGEQFNFVFSEGKTIATIDKPFPEMSKAIWELYFKLQDPIIDTDIQGANDVYLISDDDVRNVIVKRYVYFDGVGQDGQNIYKDFGVFILGFIKLPFKIDPSLIGYSDEVRLGNLETGIQADVVTTDKFTYDAGEISIPFTRNDFLDFADTTAILHLPYVESIVVDIDYVIGETLRIEYVINAYDGIAKLNLYSTKINGLILSKNVDLNIKIPFANVDDATPSKNSTYDIELGGANGIYKPYIELLKHDAILPDGFYTVPIVDERVLSEQSGYVEIEKINLLTRATESEIIGLNMLLNDGVYIND